MRSRVMAWVGVVALHAVAGGGFGAAVGPSEGELRGRFEGTVRPFVEAYCVSCHGKVKPKGDLDLTPYTSMAAVAGDPKRWQLVVEKLKAGEMPPAKAKKKPTDAARAEVVAWIGQARRFEALRNAGDPGVVLARRLSNAEYDYTIRDLTGVDIRPTKEFPVDPANEAGFDNSGESLSMSPALLKKYMEAARAVSEHLVLKPDGLDFAAFPVIAETDRDKYCVSRIVEFYKRQPTDLAEYFLAAWQFENRAALGKASATLDDVAREQHVSPKYLATVYGALTEQGNEVGPLAALRAMWRAAPVPDAEHLAAARAACAAMRDRVAEVRKKVRPEFRNLTLREMNVGSQPLILWKDRQYARTRLAYASGSALKLKADDLGAPVPSADAEGAREKFEEAFKRFCAVFPDTFAVTERARMYIDPEKEKKDHNVGRLLSAGFHSQMGYFRDDEPLCALVLDEPGRREIDALWDELDFVADVPRRTFQGMMWFERSDSRFMRTAEFDFARAEERGLLAEANLKKLEELFLAKAKKNTTDAVVIEAVKDYFEEINATSRRIDREKLEAEPKHLAALAGIAERAYRRPLSAKEREDLVGFYRSLRNEDHLEHEEALRDTLVSVLMSPYFCFRVNAAPAGDGVQPLTDYELASRLSYFIWSSMPDAELLAHSAAGDLHKTDVLVAQARRMLRDDRVRGLATEFMGNWLDFRRFEEHNGVDRERFKSFDNALRTAMFEEPIRFFVDAAKADRSVLDLVYGDYTFVNEPLARHYGMPWPSGASQIEWVRIDGARKYERGGLLPMAVFLTKNSPGLRTSPVKRGYWVVKRLLGEEIPPPPPDVPALPQDESKLGDLTLPQVLAKHRADPTCATCHEHFDAMGLAFEGFGPVGEVRKVDLGGKPVENAVTYRDGSRGTGLAGLIDYMRAKRQDDYLDNLCRKLLAEALGRTLVLSDDPLVEDLRAKLAGNGYHLGTLIEGIVTSRQFLNKRGHAGLASVGGNVAPN